MGGCTVLNGVNRNGITCANKSFHRFPSDKTTSKKWILSTRRENWEPPKSALICSRHFEPNCFVLTANKKNLIPTALPTSPTTYLNGSDNDAWDDSELQAAYDRTMQKSRLLAESKKISSVPKKNKSDPQSSKNTGQFSSKLKLGMDCRAVYEVDLKPYEAIISKILDDEHCVVKFIGYENEQVCNLKELKPSLGPDERLRQVEEAMAVEASKENPRKNIKRKHKKKHQQQLPEVEFNHHSIPNISPGIPIAPPPPMFFKSDNSNSEESSMLNSMLLSWYMAGYNTGLSEAHNRRNS